MKFPEIEKAVIFGSRSKGNYRKGSDIDIAIYGENIHVDEPLKLSATLNEEIPIPYFCDVVAPQFIESKELISHIERVGTIFYKTDSR